MAQMLARPGSSGQVPILPSHISRAASNKSAIDIAVKHEPINQEANGDSLANTELE